MKTNKKTIIFAFLLVTTLVISGCGFKPAPPPRYNVTLEIWGPFDDSTTFTDIFNNFRKIDPNVTQIVYKKMSQDTYEKDLLNALASGEGPDIFLINNTWLPSFKDKLDPAPAQILPEQTFKNNFVDVAADDFDSNGQIYAVPLTVDSLALYYNKDLFNAAGITAPPTDWTTFMKDAQLLTKFDSSGQIIQSGAAMGTADNINRASDILNLLMLQNGTQMPSAANPRAAFDQIETNGNNSFFPAGNALDFYTSFANSSDSNYSWNSDMHYSLDAFAAGNLAMMLNYSWNIPTIEAESPKLNFDVAPVPQLSTTQPVNFANYWGYAVAKNKVIPTLTSGAPKGTLPENDNVRVQEAWKFLTYLTTQPVQNSAASAASSNPTSITGSQPQNSQATFDPAWDYLQETDQPAARKDLIEKQKDEPMIGVFAEQNLIDKSWYEIDPDDTETVFLNMIDEINKGQATTTDAIKAAVAKINQLTGN